MMLPFDLTICSRNARRRTALLVATFLVLAVDAHAQGALENPGPSSRQSGIGTISGWKCDAGDLALSIDGGPSAIVAYGTGREDTRSICGDADNGFSYLINWNLLGPGTHTVSLYDNGSKFAEATFDVVTLGTSFIRGVTATKHVVDFPYSGEGTTLEWQEGLQSFVLSDWLPRGTTLVRYRGNLLCKGQSFTSSLRANGRYTFTSVDGEPSEYIRVDTDNQLRPEPVSYSDDADCSDLIPQPFVLDLLSGRRYTMQWKPSGGLGGFELELVNDDEIGEPTNVPCFAAGTVVLTASGEVPIESIEPGDVVIDGDGSLRVVSELVKTPVGTSIPLVELSPDSLAAGIPNRRTVVTPSHPVGPTVASLVYAGEFCGSEGVTCGAREVDYVYNLQLGGQYSTFVANGLVAEGLGATE
ncbi:Hint domain-containing protein [Candidatus Binatia bacterium]|nr:Hint domain-containing protein [Candidatus Binatia bacterium]